MNPRIVSDQSFELKQQPFVKKNTRNGHGCENESAEINKC